MEYFFYLGELEEHRFIYRHIFDLINLPDKNSIIDCHNSLYPNVLHWLNSNNINFRFYMSYLEFENKKDAMLFKLTFENGVTNEIY